jgi:glycogen debranching enzyme
VVTPRIGKPVEVQALWLNALWIAGQYSKQWTDLFARGLDSFRARFWNGAGMYLYDVVDVDHQPGTADGTFRPNQIFAIGGLPFAVFEGKDARRVVELVQARLWTPIGLRSLAPDEPGYIGHYEGDMRQRDGAYHQGTVWPWLMGPFVEAWVRVHGGTAEAKQRARKQFLDPLLRHLDDNGLGHICEIADGDALVIEAAKESSSAAAQAIDASQRKTKLPDRSPRSQSSSPSQTSQPKSAKQATPPEPEAGVHTPRGCPFQAWSLGEVLRLSLVVLK